MANDNSINGTRAEVTKPTRPAAREPLEAPKGTPADKVWTVAKDQTASQKAVEVLSTAYGRKPTQAEIKTYLGDMQKLNPGLKDVNKVFARDAVAMPEVGKGWLRGPPAPTAADAASGASPAKQDAAFLAVTMNRLNQAIKTGGKPPTDTQVTQARGMIEMAKANGDKGLLAEGGPGAELQKMVKTADTAAAEKAAAQAAEKAAAASAKAKADFRQSEMKDLKATAKEEARYKGGSIPDLKTALSVLGQAAQGEVKLTAEQKIDLKSALEKAALKHPAELGDPAVQRQMEKVLGGGATRPILRAAEEAAVRDANAQQAAADAKTAAATAALAQTNAAAMVADAAKQIRANPGTELDKAIKTPNPSEVTQASIERNETQKDVLSLVKRFQEGDLTTKHMLSAANLKNLLAKADKQGALAGLPPEVATQIAKLREQATATLDKK